MKRKFLAAMALAVSISAVPLTAYASATVSSSSSVNTQSQVQSESESAEVPATPESTATPTPTPDVSVTPEPSTTPEPTTTPGASEDENDQYADGWNQVTGEDGKTYWVFYDAGSSAVKKNSLFEDGQKTYLTDENGYLLTGEQQYTDEEGVVHTFYFSEDGEKPGENSEYGVRITGFAANGKYYGPELVTNQKFEADGDEYYAGEDGTISRDSFVTVDGIIYYFGEDGKRVTEEGWITVGDASYYLMDSDSDGKGEVCVDGNYASNQDENSKWLIVDGGWYLLDAQDGHRMSGLQKNGNDLYYLDPEQDDKMFCSTNETAPGISSAAGAERTTTAGTSWELTGTGSTRIVRWPATNGCTTVKTSIISGTGAQCSIMTGNRATTANGIISAAGAERTTMAGPGSESTGTGSTATAQCAAANGWKKAETCTT